MYHNQPQGSPNPNAPPRKDDPTRWRPPVAGSPAGYQQGDSPYTHTQAGAPPPQYGSTAQQPPPPVQQEGYFPAQPSPLINQAGTFPHDPHANMLATQMGTMGLGGGDAAAPDHRRKKKDRHAYHNIEGPGANEQMVNGGQGMGMASPYSPHVGGPQWQEPEITPAMSQFPAAMPLFTPGSVASPMQHAARAHTPQPGTAVQGSAQGKVDPEQCLRCHLAFPLLASQEHLSASHNPHSRMLRHTNRSRKSSTINKSINKATVERRGRATRATTTIKVAKAKSTRPILPSTGRCLTRYSRAGSTRRGLATRVTTAPTCTMSTCKVGIGD